MISPAEAISHLAESEPAPVSRVRGRTRAADASGELALLQRLRSGEPGADEAFFYRYERDVRCVLTRIMGATPDVADALQETFIRAFRNALKIREALALRAWMRRVAASVAFDHLRERQRLRWHLSPNCTFVDAPAASVTPEVHAASRDVQRVLEKLPRKERAVFHLRYVDELDMAEIAEACKVSLATTKRRLARAESRFKSLALHHPGLADWVQRESA